MNKTDNTDNVYVKMPETLYNPIRVYDGNKEGISYDFYWNKVNNRYDISVMDIIPKLVRQTWNPTILTRDQWSKLLNLLTLMSVPILSHRFDDDFNKSRSPKILMPSFDSDFSYQLKRDTLSDNRILITVIDIPTYQDIQDSHFFNPIIPYDKGLEDKIRTYLDGITRFMMNNIFCVNQLIAEQQDIRKR